MIDLNFDFYPSKIFPSLSLRLLNVQPQALHDRPENGSRRGNQREDLESPRARERDKHHREEVLDDTPRWSTSDRPHREKVIDDAPRRSTSDPHNRRGEWREALNVERVSDRTLSKRSREERTPRNRTTDVVIGDVATNSGAGGGSGHARGRDDAGNHQHRSQKSGRRRNGEHLDASVRREPEVAHRNRRSEKAEASASSAVEAPLTDDDGGVAHTPRARPPSGKSPRASVRRASSVSNSTVTLAGAAIVRGAPVQVVRQPPRRPVACVNLFPLQKRVSPLLLHTLCLII